MTKITYKVVNKIKKAKYPMGSPKYREAHNEANRAEKKEYPKGYEKMKSIDDRLPKGEYAGTHDKAGNIKVSKRVPKKERPEVARHEFVEHKKDPGACKICGKGKRGH